MYFKLQRLSAAFARPQTLLGRDGVASASPMPPTLELLARVNLQLDSVRTVGDVPDGVRFAFTVHGDVDGPRLRGTFPQCLAFLRIDRQGVGTIHVRAPMVLNDGAVAELEATGRYDFGTDGYRRALSGDLPNSDLGWAPRFLTADPRYLWLNRIFCLGIGELRPSERRVAYDLFAMRAACEPSSPSYERGTSAAADSTTLLARLGGREKAERIASDFVDALDSNAQLNRQNPKLVSARMAVNPKLRRQRFGEALCNLLGGSCNYTGRPLAEVHRHLDISEADWMLAGADFVKTLESNNVPKPLQQEVLAAISSVKSAIVTRP